MAHDRAELLRLGEGHSSNGRVVMKGAAEFWVAKRSDPGQEQVGDTRT